MGVLDKLMFWKKETVDLDYDVNGCFTLPTDGTEAESVPDLDTIAATPPAVTPPVVAPPVVTPPAAAPPAGDQC